MFGSAIMFIIPAIMNLSNSRKAVVSPNGVTLGKISKLEAVLNHLMLGSGVLMGALGIIISTLRQLGKM
jgi:hypothetical protein